MLRNGLTHAAIFLVGYFEDTLFGLVEGMELTVAFELFVVEEESYIANCELHCPSGSLFFAINSDHARSCILPHSEKIVEGNETQVSDGLLFGAGAGVCLGVAVFWDCDWECQLGHC